MTTRLVSLGNARNTSKRTQTIEHPFRLCRPPIQLYSSSSSPYIYPLFLTRTRLSGGVYIAGLIFSLKRARAPVTKCFIIWTSVYLQKNLHVLSTELDSNFLWTVLPRARLETLGRETIFHVLRSSVHK